MDVAPGVTAPGVTVPDVDLPLDGRMEVASPPGHPYGYVPFEGESPGRSPGQAAPPDLDPDEQSVYSPNLSR